MAAIGKGADVHMQKEGNIREGICTIKNFQQKGKCNPKQKKKILEAWRALTRQAQERS